MTRRILLFAAVAAVLAAALPGWTNPPAQRDTGEMIAAHAQRYVPKAAGTEDKLSLLFGPYTIPPGQDSNRTTIDLPPLEGFITAVAPDLVDATDGRIPTEQEAHIHHAHWFRLDPEHNHETYNAGVPGEPLSWVFGTGEEKSQGLFEHRWNMDPAGPLYGVPVEAANPQTLIYMIHNKTSSPLNAYVVLDVRFIHGSEAAIEAAKNRELHPIEGTLFGQTRDATPSYPQLSATYNATSNGTIVAMGSHLHPTGKLAVVANLGPGGTCTADADGDGFPGVTLLNSRKFDRVVGAGVSSEDYQMGTTKFGWRAPIHQGDHIVQFAPYTIYGGAAPSQVPAGLKLSSTDSTPDYRQYSQAQWDELLAAYPDRYNSPDGQNHAAYEAMTYTGLYVDRQAPVPLADAENVCNPANFAPWRLGPDTFEAQSLPGIVENTRGPVALTDTEIDVIEKRYNFGDNEGMINHAWIDVPDPLCGLTRTAADLEWSQTFERGCTEGLNKIGDWVPGPGLDTNNIIHVGGFTYLPGDLMGIGQLGAPPLITGDVITLINDDAAVNVRHTFTSCLAPCNGQYMANYPLPDGVFDTDKMGNVDPIDGGFSGDWSPQQDLDVADLDPGIYTYFCRIHPWMRGAFQKV